MKSRGIARAAGLIGSPSIRRVSRSRQRRAAVDHLADAVEHAAQHRRREAERQRLAEEAHDGAGQREARRRLEHLDGHHVAVERRDAAQPRAAVDPADLDRVVEPDVERALQEQQRAFESRRGAFSGEAHRRSPRGRRHERGELALHRRFERGERRELVVADVVAHPRQRPQHRERADGVRRDAGGQRGLGEVDEAADQLHHRALPRRAADAVLRRECVLPQEALVDEPRGEQHDLLPRRQRVLADDPRHPLQPRLLVEQRQEAPPQRVPRRRCRAPPTTARSCARPRRTTAADGRPDRSAPARA